MLVMVVLTSGLAQTNQESCCAIAVFFFLKMLLTSTSCCRVFIGEHWRGALVKLVCAVGWLMGLVVVAVKG